MTLYSRFVLSCIIALTAVSIGFAKVDSSTDPLVRVLVTKGVLTAEEARLISVNATPAEQRDRLATLLRDKGLISASEFEAVRTVTPAENVALKTMNADYKTTASNTAASPQPSPPSVIGAVAPVRLLGIYTPKREGLIPDIKLCTAARLNLYGIFKTSIIHDSSSPQGNDFPLPLLAADTGPNNSPEFHLRARGLRLRAHCQWLSPAPRPTLTAKIEFEFARNLHRA